MNHVVDVDGITSLSQVTGYDDVFMEYFDPGSRTNPCSNHREIDIVCKVSLEELDIDIV